MKRPRYHREKWWSSDFSNKDIMIIVEFLADVSKKDRIRTKPGYPTRIIRTRTNGRWWHRRKTIAPHVITELNLMKLRNENTIT